MKAISAAGWAACSFPAREALKPRARALRRREGALHAGAHDALRRERADSRRADEPPRSGIHHGAEQGHDRIYRLDALLRRRITNVFRPSPTASWRSCRAALSIAARATTIISKAKSPRSSVPRSCRRKQRPAFIPAEVRKASRLCSRGRFDAISHALKSCLVNGTRHRFYGILRQQEEGTCRGAY